MGETLELAERLMTALANRDVGTMVALSHPDVEWHSFFASLGHASDGVYRGHDGARQYVADLADAWDIARADIDDSLAVGDVVLMVGRIHYRGKGSGVETETAAGWVLRFSGDRLVSFQAFRDPEQALARLGSVGGDSR